MPRTRSRRKAREGSSARGRRGLRRWLPWLLAAALIYLGVGAVVRWQRLGRIADLSSRTGSIGPVEANGIALRLASEGNHLAALPYFREVVRQDPTSSYAHSNLASGLGNSAQQARAHLGRTDNAVRSSVERIAMLKESLAETELAERYATTREDRMMALFERGRAFNTWGFPVDALARFRAAGAIAPERADVQATIARLERELAAGNP